MKNKEQWTWEYDNDVGPRDDSFRKFWNIYCDNAYIGEVRAEIVAIEITNILNTFPILVSFMKEALTELENKTDSSIEYIFLMLKKTILEAAEICKTSHEKII